jgi:hypothetical protein
MLKTSEIGCQAAMPSHQHKSVAARRPSVICRRMWSSSYGPDCCPFFAMWYELMSGFSSLHPTTSTLSHGGQCKAVFRYEQADFAAFHVIAGR